MFKLNLKVTTGDIKPTSSWGPQLAQKGIKTGEFCQLLEQKIQNLNYYPEGTILNLRVIGGLGAEKKKYEFEIVGEIYTSIVKSVLGVNNFKETKICTEEQLKEIIAKVKSDPSRYESRDSEIYGKLIGVLKSMKVVRIN